MTSTALCDQFCKAIIIPYCPSIFVVQATILPTEQEKEAEWQKKKKQARQVRQIKSPLELRAQTAVMQQSQ